jgi:hypothetical protein
VPPVASAPSASVVVAPPAPPPGPARVDLAARKSTHFLGENVLVDFCVVDTSPSPITISVGGDYGGSSRSLRFKVEVRDAAGQVMPDPDPNPVNFGGMGYSPKIEPGARWCQSLQLMRYARIDAPGTYTITATHDLGWKSEKPPVGTTKISLAMPNAAEAENVIAAMEALPDDPNGSAGKVSPAYADFSALRYDVYTAPLAKRASAGDLRAIDGLTNIPSQAATRVLVGLLSNPSREVARAAARGLAMRLPDPALSGALGARNPFEATYADQRKYLGRAWVPALADDVRAAADQRLASSTAEDVTDGAFMIEAVGTPADGPDVVKALDAAMDRTRTAPPETDVYPTPRGACQELLRAAEILVDRKLAAAAKPKSPGEIAVWLVALSRGARPSAWEAELGRAMRHPIAYVRQLALERAPHGALSPALVTNVGADLVDRDLDVVVAAAQLAEGEHLAPLAPAVVRAMPKATDLRLNALATAAWSLGARYDRAKMLVSMLSNAAAFPQAFSELAGVIAHHGSSSSGQPTEAERKALAARWTQFITLHRADIEAGRTVPFKDPSVTPDLLPTAWKLDP